MFGKSKENPMEKEDTKTKKTLKSKSNVINTKPQLPGVNEQGSAVAKDPIVEKVLSLSQRRQRALQMRKNEPKLERGRKLAKNKFAPEQRLKARASVAAREVVRRKFAGQRGLEYATLSPSDKIMVDKLIDKKTALIKKIATRLYPRIRKAETERLSSVRAGKAPSVKAGALGASPLMQSVDMRGLVDAMLTEEMNAKMDKLLRLGLGDKDKLNQYRQALKNPDQAGKYVVLRKHLISMLDKLSKLVTDDPTVYQKTAATLQKQRDYPSDKVAESLQLKAAKTDIPVSILAEVFNRGYSSWDKSNKKERCNAEQYAFARVNSFISGGKARELDSDLVEKKDPCWKGYKMVGMKKKNGRPVPNCVPEETAIETKPKVKDKTVKREIYKIQLKSADPESMTEARSAIKKIKKAMDKC
jgi:hypothetical protein